jgi:4-amino-4-deoxy-L-arabinose transferase-like glycosyltransferase
LRNALRHKALAVAIIAFAFRMGLLTVFPGPNYYDGISRSYLEVATNVLAGKGIVVYVNIAPISNPTPQWSYEPFIDRPLGYLFLILLPLMITLNPVGVQILHALLSSLSAVLLFDVGKRITSERAAWRAALVYALWPLSARFEVTILPDAVMSFFLLLSLWLLVRGTKEDQLRWFLLAGIACGIGITVRPDILLLPFFFIAGLLLMRVPTRFLQASLLLVAGVIIIVGAHTVRNFGATGGKIVPIGLGNGISLWEGISQFGDTLGTLYGDERLAALEGYAQWAYPDGIERDRIRFQTAVEIIRQHPAWYAGVMLKRIPVLLTPDWIMTRKFAPSLKEYLEASPGNSISAYVASYPFASLIRLLLTLLQYGTLLLSAIALVKDWRNMLLWFPGLIIFYYIILHIPTNAEARYFYPAIPIILLLASHAWDLLRHSQRDT